MTVKQPTEVERPAAQIDRKLAAMEARETPPSLPELNATRRLIEWLERERALERSKRLTTS